MRKEFSHVSVDLHTNRTKNRESLTNLDVVRRRELDFVGTWYIAGCFNRDKLLAVRELPLNKSNEHNS